MVEKLSVSESAVPVSGRLSKAERRRQLLDMFEIFQILFKLNFQRGKTVGSMCHINIPWSKHQPVGR